MANYEWEDQDSVEGELLQQKQEDKLLSQVQLPKKQYPDISNNPPAESFWSTGRNCPRCAGFLAIKEFRQDQQKIYLYNSPQYGSTIQVNTLVVYCTDCGSEYHHQDLEDLNNDWLFRQIPQEMILRYVADMERKGR